MAHEPYMRNAKNGKAVLFIHGFLGSPEHFSRFLPYVPSNWGIYNVLLDGHGGTVQDFSRSSMSIWKQQIKKVVDELSLNHQSIIIVGHSMGTFFAMNEAMRRPNLVKGLILLQSPLKIGLKFASVLNSFKSIFNLISDDDEIGRAYQNAHSVKLTKCFWQYVRWVPHYLDLFKESKKARTTILGLSVPTLIYQSQKDELVSMASLRYIPQKSNIFLIVLTDSAHFIYQKEDCDKMIKGFVEMIEKIENERI